MQRPPYNPRRSTHSLDPPPPSPPPTLRSDRIAVSRWSDSLRAPSIPLEERTNEYPRTCAITDRRVGRYGDRDVITSSSYRSRSLDNLKHRLNHSPAPRVGGLHTSQRAERRRAGQSSERDASLSRIQEPLRARVAEDSLDRWRMGFRDVPALASPARGEAAYFSPRSRPSFSSLASNLSSPRSQPHRSRPGSSVTGGVLSPSGMSHRPSHSLSESRRYPTGGRREMSLGREGVDQDRRSTFHPRSSRCFTDETPTSVMMSPPSHSYDTSDVNELKEMVNKLLTFNRQLREIIRNSVRSPPASSTLCSRCKQATSSMVPPLPTASPDRILSSSPGEGLRVLERVTNPNSLTSTDPPPPCSDLEEAIPARIRPLESLQSSLPPSIPKPSDLTIKKGLRSFASPPEDPLSSNRTGYGSNSMMLQPPDYFVPKTKGGKSVGRSRLTKMMQEEYRRREPSDVVARPLTEDSLSSRAHTEINENMPPPPVTKTPPFIPSLRLDAVGQSGWFSGHATNGDTYTTG